VLRISREQALESFILHCKVYIISIIHSC
jgi:hypothetical protein